MLAGITVGGIAMEYDINVNLLFEWRKQYGRGMPDNGSANIQHYCQWPIWILIRHAREQRSKPVVRYPCLRRRGSDT